MLTDTHRCGLLDTSVHITDTRCYWAAAASGASSPLLDRLTNINLDDLFDAAGLMWLMWLRRTPLRRLPLDASHPIADAVTQLNSRIEELLPHRRAVAASLATSQLKPGSVPTRRIDKIAERLKINATNALELSHRALPTPSPQCTSPPPGFSP